MNNSTLVPYGLRAERLFSIAEVESGLSCDCMCPYCKLPLVAKKGKQKVHHFAHHDSEPCKHAKESAIHLMAKQILLDHQRIWLPGYWTENEDSKGDCIECLVEGEYLLNNVVAENKFHTIVPDIFASRDDIPLMIEIYVTHKITPAKKSKIKELGVDCLEIDLSKLSRYQDITELEQIVIEKSDHKKWIYSEKYEAQELRLAKFHKPRDTVEDLFRELRYKRKW